MTVGNLSPVYGARDTRPSAEQELRLRCLEAATKIIGQSEMGSVRVVDLAAAFEEYVRHGAKVPA